MSRTSALSGALLTAFTTPTVVVLSKLFLKVKYRSIHYLGVVICLAGLGLLILSDYLLHMAKGDEGKGWLFYLVIRALVLLYGNQGFGSFTWQSELTPRFNRSGNCRWRSVSVKAFWSYYRFNYCLSLTAAGALLYGVSNVMEEYYAHRQSFVEILAFLGVFGTIISGVQLGILERGELAEAQWTIEFGTHGSKIIPPAILI